MVLKNAIDFTARVGTLKNRKITKECLHAKRLGCGFNWGQEYCTKLTNRKEFIRWNFQRSQNTHARKKKQKEITKIFHQRFLNLNFLSDIRIIKLIFKLTFLIPFWDWALSRTPKMDTARYKICYNKQILNSERLYQHGVHTKGNLYIATVDYRRWNELHCEQTRPRRSVLEDKVS